MSTKRAGIAAAALMLMTALSPTPTFAAADPGLRQAEDFHFRAVGAGGGDSLTDMESRMTDVDLQSADQVIANHKLRCSC
jgi:hypothetical protein